MDQHSGNQEQNKRRVDTSLRLGLPQFHKNHKEPGQQSGRVCLECGCGQTTPTWRRGPKGPGTLCNACGLKHMRKQKDGNNAGDEE